MVKFEPTEHQKGARESLSEALICQQGIEMGRLNGVNEQFTQLLTI